MSTLSRRNLIQATVAGAIAAALHESHAVSQATTGSIKRGKVASVVREAVREQFHSLPFESQQIGGLFGERMRVNVAGRLLNIDEHALTVGFTKRHENADQEGLWIGEHAGKFVDAACNALALEENAQLRASMERVAKALITTQEADGYMGTYPPAKRWTSWDVWVHKYNLIGLMSYYQLTGDASGLTACRKIGDLLSRTFGEAPGQKNILDGADHMGMTATSVLEPMVTLYRFSGEKRYLEFCHYLVRACDDENGPRLIAAMLDKGDVFLAANGKAYEMLSNFNGLVDLYRMTGEARLLEAVLRGWEDIVRHQLYITGTASAMECFQPAGRLLSMKSSNMGEMCVTVTWLQLNARLLRLTGEPRFARELERTIYNHLLGGQHPRTGDFSYYTPLVGSKEYTHHILCCVSSGPRGVSLIPQLVWGIEEEAFVVMLYTPGRASFEIKGVPIDIVSETRFPEEGDVTLSIHPKRDVQFTLRLRVPEWVEDFEATDGSQVWSGTSAMLDIARTWRPASRLEIRMKLPARVLPAPSNYPQYIAVQRGPQVLALDEKLNGNLPYLHRVALGQEITLSAETGKEGRPVYEVEAMIGVPGDGDQLAVKPAKVRLAPFANVASGRVWLSSTGKLKTTVPAVTAFQRSGMSVWNYHIEPKQPGQKITDVTEYLNDDDLATECRVDPRNVVAAWYTKQPQGKRGDSVWAYVVLEEPVAISRVTFTHGPMTPEGGWFDTREVRPRFEFVRDPIAIIYGLHLDVARANWQALADLDGYPETDATTVPMSLGGRTFEIRLPQPLTVRAIRVYGRPGGDYVSCADLSAFA